MKLCKTCGEPIDEKRMFCGKRCQLQWNNLHPILIKFHCEFCDKDFELRRSSKNRHIIACENQFNKMHKIHSCEECKKDYIRKDGISERYCSRACANKQGSKYITEDGKQRRDAGWRTPESLQKGKDTYLKGLEEGKYKRKRRNNELKIIQKRYTYYCKKCGEIITSRRHNTNSPAKDLCNKCYTTGELLSWIQKDKVEKGIHQGWMSRNLDSYAEKFWITVLNNNGIHYQREKKVGIYFVDFFIQKENRKIALEIDGKQHDYEDRKLSDIKKGDFLASLGYEVFRVKWNEINSKEGSELMKQKIDSFMSYIGSNPIS